jgi:peptidoglycan/xylan/chitin deacetylase (PgdA/CDA1 family)
MAGLIRRRIATVAHRLSLESMIRVTGQSHIFPFYHVVSDWHLPHIRHLYRYRRVDEFKKDLEQMLTYYEPVSLSDFLRKTHHDLHKPRIEDKKRRFMVLTFDDGLVECHQTIAPILKQKGIPATFFLNNYFIDNRGLFYRFRASLVIDKVISDCKAREKAAEFLNIPEDKIEVAIGMIKYDQHALLDRLAKEVEVDFVDYLREYPVYMNSQQVKELVDWGFEIGGHSPEHADFSLLDTEAIITRVKASIEDLQQRFGTSNSYFSFPFTSCAVPGEVIKTLMEEHHVKALLGTSGLKKTGKQGFIQRIPMEEFDMPALEALKGEYLYYILKKPLFRNRYRY